MADNVNHPSHYNAGKIEVIDAIEDWKLGFHAGNVIKYVARAPHKNGLEDLKKAAWYLARLIELEEGKVNQAALVDIGKMPEWWMSAESSNGGKSISRVFRSDRYWLGHDGKWGPCEYRFDGHDRVIEVATSAEAPPGWPGLKSNQCETSPGHGWRTDLMLRYAESPKADRIMVCWDTGGRSYLLSRSGLAWLEERPVLRAVPSDVEFASIAEAHAAIDKCQVAPPGWKEAKAPLFSQ